MQTDKPKLRVVDVPTTATAAEAQALINAPYDEGYYLAFQTAAGLPDGTGSRFVYRFPVRSRRDH